MESERDLVQFLRNYQSEAVIPPSHIPAISRLLSTLWNGIAGSSAYSMAPHKLSRMEDVKWTAPILSFTIERHGAAVNGSTRAELQRWKVNLETLEAQAHQIGRRQIAPTAPRIKLEPIVEEVFDLITSSAADEGLKWHDNKSRVRIVIGNFVPDDGFQMTVSSRRRRFLEKLTTKLAEVGWKQTAGSTRWTFIKPAPVPSSV